MQYRRALHGFSHNGMTCFFEEYIQQNSYKRSIKTSFVVGS